MPFGPEQIGQDLEVEAGGYDEEDAVAANANHVGLPKHHVRGHRRVGHQDGRALRRVTAAGARRCHLVAAVDGVDRGECHLHNGHDSGQLCKCQCACQLVRMSRDQDLEICVGISLYLVHFHCQFFFRKTSRQLIFDPIVFCHAFLTRRSSRRIQCLTI